MKRCLLLTVAFALLLSTAAGIAANLGTHARRSPVHHFDVMYDGQVVGKATVNTVNEQLPSYVLVARGLSRNTTYTFGYVVSGEVCVIGSKDTTKGGALVVNGTFPLDDVEDLKSAQFWAMEMPPAGSYQAINGLVLGNYYGWFITKIACYYSTDGGVTWIESSYTDGIAKGESADVYLRDLGVPDGALVRIHAIVVGGKDRTGSEVFQCSYFACGRDLSERYAVYYIDGVTWKPVLSFDRIQDISW